MNSYIDEKSFISALANDNDIPYFIDETEFNKYCEIKKKIQTDSLSIFSLEDITKVLQNYNAISNSNNIVKNIETLVNHLKELPGEKKKKII